MRKLISAEPKAKFVRLGESMHGRVATSADDDFHGWLVEQATMLRTRQTELVDWDTIAEELEAMARSERRELLRRLTTLMEHFLKMEYQPDQVARRGGGWAETIFRSRDEINQLLEFSPGLQSTLEEYVAMAYPKSRRRAGRASGLTPNKWDDLYPRDCPWSVYQLLNDDSLSLLSPYLP